jgi:hypothetical protein
MGSILTDGKKEKKKEGLRKGEGRKVEERSMVGLRYKLD